MTEFVTCANGTLLAEGGKFLTVGVLGVQGLIRLAFSITCLFLTDWRPLASDWRPLALEHYHEQMDVGSPAPGASFQKVEVEQLVGRVPLQQARRGRWS